MLQDIRDNSQGTIAKIIIGLICATFALVGVESILGGGSGNKVAEVNGEAIGAQELNEAIYLRKRQLVAQMGDNLDPSMLDDNRLLRPVLESLVEQKLNVQTALNSGFAISDLQINQLITQSPEFQEDGVFSQNKFDQLVAASGLSSSTFKRLYHADLLLNQFANGIVQSAYLTDAELAADAKFMYQTRDIRFIELSLEEEKKNITLNDEDVLAFYNENQQAFMAEEQVQLEYVELKKADFFKEPSASDVEAAYQDEIALISRDETREVAHILIDSNQHDNAQARGEEVLAALDSGKDFSELVAQYSDDFGSKDNGGYLGEVSEDIFPTEFVDAANVLAEGEVSPLISTDSGLHIIKVTAVKQAVIPTLDERRDVIADNLKQANAEPLFWEAVEELKDISFNAPDLSEPAEALNIELQSTSLFARSTADELLSKPALQAQAFSAELIKEGVNSDLIELANDHVLVLRVVKHVPETVKPFELVKNDAQAQLSNEKAAKALSEKSERIQKQLLEGETVEAVAKANNQKWQLSLGAKRSSTDVPASLLQAVFKTGQLDADASLVDVTTLSNGNQAVFSVSNPALGQASDASMQEKMMMTNYFAQSQGMSQFQSISAQAKAESDIEYLR